MTKAAETITSLISGLNAEERAQYIVQSLEACLQLLTAMPVPELGQAMFEHNVERNLQRYKERQQNWRSVYEDIAEDLARQVANLTKHREDSHAAIALARHAISVFNSKEFKEGTENLERFVKVCVQFQQLKKEGFLDTIIETIGRT